MKTPGPDHPITLEPAGSRMRALIAGHVIADTKDALVLKEASLKPVVYFPKKDVEMGFSAKTEKSTTCPYKGEAAYYTFDIEGGILENVAWSYDEPYPAMQDLAGRIAFYTDQVEVYAVEEPVSRKADTPHQPAP